MTKDFSIEFENLVEEDVPEEFVSGGTYGSWPVTKHETQLVKQGMLYELVVEQAKADKQIEEQLAAQEEALKMEEEAYYAERRAAAAVARQHRAAASAAVTSSHRPGDPLSVTLTPCDAKGDWSDVELDDEAFEAAEKEARAKEGRHGRGHGLSGDLRPTDSEEFLRRASTGPGPPASAHNRLLQQRLNQGFGDFQSVSSGGREASIDLDWDHEPGMNPALAEGMARSATEEDLARLADAKRPPSAPLSPAATRAVRADSPASLVWEHDPAMDFSRRHLLAEDT